MTSPFLPSKSKQMTVAAKMFNIATKISFYYPEGTNIKYAEIGYGDLKVFIPSNFYHMFLDLKKVRINLSDKETVEQLKSNKENIVIELQTIYDLFGVNAVEALIKNYLNGDVNEKRKC